MDELTESELDRLLQTADPTLGGTVRILTAAVMRLADENLALSEQVTHLRGLLEGTTPDDDGTEGETLEEAAGPGALSESLGDALARIGWWGAAVRDSIERGETIPPILLEMSFPRRELTAAEIAHGRSLISILEADVTEPDAAVPPDDIADAEYVRLLHETALPLGTPEKAGDAADLISFGGLEW
jgi:hypothetical protein